MRSMTLARFSRTVVQSLQATPPNPTGKPCIREAQILDDWLVTSYIALGPSVNVPPRDFAQLLLGGGGRGTTMGSGRRSSLCASMHRLPEELWQLQEDLDLEKGLLWI